MVTNVAALGGRRSLQRHPIRGGRGRCVGALGGDHMGGGRLARMTKGFNGALLFLHFFHSEHDGVTLGHLQIVTKITTVLTETNNEEQQRWIEDLLIKK